MVIYRRRTKVILALTSLIAIYCCTQLHESKSLRNLPRVRSDTILPYVVFHLDFKGAPPKLSYMTSLLNNLRLLGVTALLMEYEDMFPYEGSLRKLKAPNCYTRVELQQFLSKAVALGIEIIPLVQTFGHLEFVLKHKEYVHLCENRTEYGSICPSRKESRKLLRQMLEQIITFHEAISPVKHLHVGCDEVFHLNECKLCREQRLSNIVQYERHVAFICDTVHDLSPHTTVLIWDDMLQQHGDLMQPIALPVEPVAWDYAANIQLKPANIYKLYKNYKTIWIASAYKGADGETASYANLEVRFRNHYSWIQQLVKYEGLTQPSVKNFKGIILTGWSRYNHFKPICELLPTAMPSLVVNLLLIKLYRKTSGLDVRKEWMDFYDTYLHEEVVKSLGCDENIEIISNLQLNCNYTGSALTTAMEKFENFSTALDVVYKHNIQNNFKNVPSLIQQFRINLWQIMSEFYDESAIAQYVDEKSYELTYKFKRLKSRNKDNNVIQSS